MINFNKLSDKTTTPFDQASDWNQKIAEAKADFLELVDGFIKFHQTEPGKTKMLKQFLKRFNQGLVGQKTRERLRCSKITLPTYYRWQRAFDMKGLSGLLEGYGKKSCRIDPEIREEIEKIVWEKHLCQYQDVFEYLEFIFPGKPLPCYSTVKNYAKKYRAENWAALVYRHEGKEGLRDRGMEVVIGRKDADLTEPNQRWEIDTTLADLFTGKKIQDVRIKTQDGKRCKIIGIIDVFSRLPKFYFVEDESGLLVGLILKDRILKWGLPKELVIDNGKPFKNNRIQSFCRCTGIKLHVCNPGSPQEKPHIERAFGTLTGKLFRKLCGYSGNSISTRPNEIGVRYTRKEAQKILDDYIDGTYAEAVHGSTGQRPRERMRPPGFTPKTIDERELDILLMEEHVRRINQAHIKFRGGRYFNPKLPEGQKVTIRVNDFDASELIVFLDRKFLCIAEDYLRKGKTPKDIKVAKRERTKELRTRIQAHGALLDKDTPKDEYMINLIEHNKERKPVKLPKKAEIIDFDEFKNIPYTGPEAEKIEDEKVEIHDGVEHEGKIYVTATEKYKDLMRQKLRGKSLDNSDQSFLDEYRKTDLYRDIGKSIDMRLRMDLEAINEG